MDFQVYLVEYTKQAKKNDFTDEEIKIQLAYAKKLNDSNLPIIYDCAHLALILGVKVEYLYSIANDQLKHYTEFLVKKKNGEESRRLSAPLPILREIQIWIFENILSKLEISEYSKSYRKGTSIKSAAKFHRKQKVLLTVDIKDYFQSITFNKVLNVFLRCGYYKSVAVLLSNLCTLRNSLPQGAVTSPVLSNICTMHLDKRIAGVAKKHSLRYTRYADDIALSGDFKPNEILANITKVLNQEGFNLNLKKIKIRKYFQQQVVTGIVVNNKLQVKREYRDKIKQEVYYINKYGLSDHFNRLDDNCKYENEKAYIRNLLGRINHVCFVNPSDNNMKRYRMDIIKIIAKYSM